MWVGSDLRFPKIFDPKIVSSDGKKKLGLKFVDSRVHTSTVIQICIKIQHVVCGHLGFGISFSEQ
jgi:hypothetical protein